LIQARNDADQILAALDKQLNEYGRLVTGEERGRLDSLVASLMAARAGNDRELIAKLVEELNEVSTPFAHRIMEEALKLALEKRTIEEVS